MRTRNYYLGDDRRRNKNDRRWESSYRGEWRPEPFDEFRGYYRSSGEQEHPYHRDRENYSQGERYHQPEERYPSYKHHYAAHRNDPYRDHDAWSHTTDHDEYDREYSRRDERDDWYDERDDRYTKRAESYKGRYYGRQQSPQDLRDIRRRYEESRRNSEWSSGYLPQSNY